MANEYAFQTLAQDMTKVRADVVKLLGAMTAARDFLSDVRGYAIDLKALVTATRPVTVQNWPSPPQSVTVSGTPNVAVTNTPTGSTAAVSLTATGDLVAAQAGVAIRLLAGVFSSTLAVTVAVRDGATDKIPLRIDTNATVVLPFVPTGWVTTTAGNALRMAFSAGPTVTGYALWVAA